MEQGGWESRGRGGIKEATLAAFSVRDSERAMTEAGWRRTDEVLDLANSQSQKDPGEGEALCRWEEQGLPRAPSEKLERT